MPTFDKQDAMASEILTEHRGKALAIVKATRAGATTSLLKAACDLGQKTVIVAPYIEIFEKTVEDAKKLVKESKPESARISANKDMCRKVEEKIQKHGCLKDFPFLYRPSCKRCEYNKPEMCRLQNILSEEWDILGLTYAKLRALSISESETALDLLQKVKTADNLILDEFVTGIITATPAIRIEGTHDYLEKEFDYFKEMLELDPLKTPFWTGMANFAIIVEGIGKDLVEGKYRVCENPVKAEVGDFYKENFSKCWKLIEDKAIEGKNTKILQQLILAVAADRVFISKKDGRISITPVANLNDVAKGSRYLVDFTQRFFSKSKLVALVDACLPDLDLNKSLDIKVESYGWGDPLGTNKSQLIVCDTRKISEYDFFKSGKLQNELKDTIKALSDLHNADTILVATQNTGMHDVLKAWQNKEEISSNLLITYYRSDISRGITIDDKRRVLILVGGPYLPREAYLPETCTAIGQDRNLQNTFKKSDMKSAFINIIGRVKDSEAQQLSIVYALGLTGIEVRALVSQTGVQSPLMAVFRVQGVRSGDFATAGDLFLETPRERWVNLEEDLPILTRMIRKCLEDGEVQCGRIVPHNTERVQQIAEEYCDILKKYNIKVNKAKRGLSLVYSEGQKQGFSHIL